MGEPNATQAITLCLVEREKIERKKKLKEQKTGVVEKKIFFFYVVWHVRIKQNEELVK